MPDAIEAFFKTVLYLIQSIAISQTLLPNIERDGHHSVEDDDIRPECEEG